MKDIKAKLKKLLTQKTTWIGLIAFIGVIGNFAPEIAKNQDMICQILIALAGVYGVTGLHEKK